MSATRHLSWDEDAAYRRLLDVYYTTEKALPSDVSKVCRLVLASTEDQRAAVKTVLEEFFQLTESGWVNSRADDELAAMRVKVQESDEKNVHEKTRKERYRERRAFLFAFLRGRDVVPAYDIGMKELIGEATRHGWDGTFGNVPGVPVPSDTSVPHGVPLERSGNVSEDAPGTAIPIPIPIPITPKGVKGGRAPKPLQVEIPDWLPKPEWDEFVAMRRLKGNRAPFTEAAAKGIVSEVEKLRSAGHDPAAVLRQSVMNGWSGVFAIKPGGSARAKAGPVPKWVSTAGFATEAEANNARCWQHNASEFRDGQRIAEAA